MKTNGTVHVYLVPYLDFVPYKKNHLCWNQQFDSNGWTVMGFLWLVAVKILMLVVQFCVLNFADLRHFAASIDSAGLSPVFLSCLLLHPACLLDWKSPLIISEWLGNWLLLVINLPELWTFLAAAESSL